MRLRARLVLTTFAVALPVAVTLAWFYSYFEERTTTEAFAQFVLTYMQNGGREECEAKPENWSAGGFQFFRPPPDKPNWLSRWFAPFDRDKPPDMPDFQPPPPWPEEQEAQQNKTNAPPLYRPPGPPIEDPFSPPHHPPPPRDRIFAYDKQLHSSNISAPPISEALKKQVESDKISNGSFAINSGNPPFSQILVRMPWDDGPCAFILARFHRPHFGGMGGLMFTPVQFWLIPLISICVALLLSIGPVISRVRLLTREVMKSKDARYQPEISVTGKDEIGELALAFKEAGKEIRSQIAMLEQRERSLRNFLENTTHDVMIPLTVLQNHLSTIMQALSKGERPEETVVSEAMNETQYIVSLLNNLSTAAKIEAGMPNLQWESVDLKGVIKRIVRRHRTIAVLNKISLDYAVPENSVLTCGDVTFIEQAVSNVVNNAISYNHENGHVAIILEVVEQEKFRLRVIDDGPGIPEEEMSRLVERFYRGNSARTREPKGQGLGLNIAYELAKMHGWKFNLSKSEHGGLQVEFSGALRQKEGVCSPNNA